MTQVLLSAALKIDGVSYSSEDIVDFPSALAASIVSAGSGSLSPKPAGGRLKVHTQLAAQARASARNDGAAAILSQSLTAYTFALPDAGQLVVTESASPVTLTVPADADVPFPIGSVLNILWNGAGQPSFSAGNGVTINKQSGKNAAVAAQYTVASVVKTGADTWTLFGALG